MKKRIKTRFAFLVNWIIILMLAAVSGCNPGQKNAEAELEKLSWLAGSWQQHSDAGILTETWRRNGRELRGKSYLLDNGDTVFTETISLEIRKGKVYYVPVIPDQNAGKETLFKLLSTENGRFVFENRQHDFPQRIIYRQLPGDSLIARIEGEVKGKLKFEEFKMKRIK